ncbi:MAG: hypothetical protein ACE5R6_03120 [Candidatus Heimdallarchaeota archaeon]
MEIPFFVDKKEAECFIIDNWERLFYRPRQYRLDPKQITNVDVEILRSGMNLLDFLLTLEMKIGDQTKYFRFYEAILVKEKASHSEVVLGQITVRDTVRVLVDAFSSPRYMEGLINELEEGKKRKNLILLGDMSRELGEIHISSIQCLYTIYPSTNYTYILHLVKKSVRKEERIFVKRFTPRAPIDRGNQEYEILMTLQDLKIVPKVYGALAAMSKQYASKQPLILVIFSTFLENVEEAGARIWREMSTIAQGMNKGREKIVMGLVEGCIQKVVAPFHVASIQQWRSKPKFAVEGTRCYDEFFAELQDNLQVLVQYGLLTKNEILPVLKTFSHLWNAVLIHTPLTEIHHDLMWKQILIDHKNRHYLLDLDEHIPCHAAKDLADLMAANRFIAEKLIKPLVTQKRKNIRKIAEKLNSLILSSYVDIVRKEVKDLWLKELEVECLGYLTFRHLHDAAYFAPISDDPDHKHSVEFSMHLFKKNFEALVTELQRKGT